MIKPLSPLELKGNFPDSVIESFNELITEKWDGDISSFSRDEILDRILSKMKSSREEIFAKHWLDIEKLYRLEGWNVRYNVSDKKYLFYP